MSDEAFERLVNLVVRELAKSDRPVAPDQLIRQVLAQDGTVSSADVRRAIWHLETEHRIDFEPDWTIRVAAAA